MQCSFKRSKNKYIIFLLLLIIKHIYTWDHIENAAKSFKFN